MSTEAKQAATKTVDVDSLQSVQNLVMETLAARIRLGEHAWTFRTRERAAIEALAALGLVTYKSASTYGHLLVWMTDAGKRAMFDPESTYVAPLQRQLDDLRSAQDKRREESDPGANGVVRELSQGEIVRMLTEAATARKSRIVGSPDWVRTVLEAEAGALYSAAQVAAGDVMAAEMMDVRVD